MPLLAFIVIGAAALVAVVLTIQRKDWWIALIALVIVVGLILAYFGHGQLVHSGPAA
jgi:hypothetical protein